ncbi:MAG: integral rane protein-like protein [Mycobacterium sp.]|nr:integral rane protein-like protein [Mycobacterium sp.]
MAGTIQVLSIVSAVGCALAAGVFFAFSTFVMPALAKLPHTQGIAAMQAINIAAVRPGLMLELFGTAAACVATSIFALTDWQIAYGPFVLAGAVLYLVGAIGLTAGFHQPRNLALADVDSDSDEAAGLWKRYLAEWSAWTHDRTVAPLLASAAFLIGAVRV